LKNLRWLALTSNPISDDGLKHLGELPYLGVLKLSGTDVTDQGLRELRGLKNLSGLTLDRTKVSDLGLKYLAGLPRFEWAASPRGVAEELARRLQRKDYQAIDDMLAVGLTASSIPQRGESRIKSLDAIERSASDRLRGWHRFRLEMHWTESPAKPPKTFYADLAVDRGTAFLYDMGILDR
jgi:hypothetical protein